MITNVKFIESNFETVLPLWREVLWPNRKTEICPTNGIQYLGGYSFELEKRTPHFFILQIGNDTIGATSFFKTHDDWGRIRGNVILPKFRGQGLGQLMFKQVETHMRNAGLNHSWSLVRQPAAQFYASLGYQLKSDWIENEYEYGPNAFAHKKL